MHHPGFQQPGAPPYPYPPPPQFAFDNYQFNYHHSQVPPPYFQGSSAAMYQPVDSTALERDRMVRYHESESRAAYGTGSLAQPRRKRVSAILADRLGASEAEERLYGRQRAADMELERDGMESASERSQLKKEPRRRNIYIPDDTTVFTIHPGGSDMLTDGTLGAAGFAAGGINMPPQHRRQQKPQQRGREQTPDCGLELVTLSEEEEEQDLVPALKKAAGAVQDKDVAKRSRRSLAAAPKRAPLRESSKTRQSVSFADEVFGPDTGKENRPPQTSAATSTSSRSGGGLKEKAKRRPSLLSGSFFGHSSSTSSKPTKQAKVAVPATKASFSIEQERLDLEAEKPRPTMKKRLRSENGSVISESHRSPRLRKTAAAPTIKQAHAHQRANSQHSRTQSSSSVLSSTSGSKYNATVTDPGSSDASSDDVSEEDEPIPTSQAPRGFSQSAAAASSNMVEYRVLAEDLANPEMYEENWLEHQQITLTELLNSILVHEWKVDSATESTSEHKTLRGKMLRLYQEPQFPLLFKRLTASLQYGALCEPNEVVEKKLRLRNDIGMCKKFVELFVETYSLPLLRAAAETVVGRECPLPSIRSSVNLTESEKEDKKSKFDKQAIAKFVERCLVQHADVVRSGAKVGTIGAIARATESANANKQDGGQVWAWRRTVHRSLMLVLLLDQAKAKQVTGDSLFQSSSPFKSSLVVLQALSKLLLPSLGDVVKPLRNLNYAVETAQYPLQEFNYGIRNLATDLRDGIRLTRLVEVLQFGQSNQKSDDDEDDYPLSRHLRYPCPDKARKCYNVQIALSALQSVKGVSSQLARDLRAEDIVDGHCEKTLSLLWVLLGPMCMPLPVRCELKLELRRQVVETMGANSAQLSKLDLNAMDYETSLQLWAQMVAGKDGLKVGNLTTSFADGKVFEAVIDAYLPLVPGASEGLAVLASRSAASARSTLSSKLKAIGFSKSFASLFDVTMSVPSSRSTVATLSLLASRFLPFVPRHRAAAVIQRSVRQLLARRTAHRRVTLMRLAYHCSVIVNAREKLVGAAESIQRAWKKTLQRRHDRVVGEVERFQVLAKGFLTRKRVRRAGNRSRSKAPGAWV